MPVPAQGEYDLNSKFSIHASQWFGWQMNPGYFGERCVPYFSPIYVTRVAPLKTGKGILEHIEFAWLERCCPHIVEAYPISGMNAAYSGSVSLYLDRTFGTHPSK